MKIKNIEAYNSYKIIRRISDPSVFTFAENWANLMESGVSRYTTIKDIAEETLGEAFSENFTSRNYTLAINLLINHWAYGEELKTWHNAKQAGVGYEALTSMNLGLKIN